MSEDIDSILDFWFGDRRKGGATATEVSATEIAEEKAAMWWSKNENIDRDITERFAATTEAAAAGQLDHWAQTPHGLLALIICTDQFPRNMYRDTPKAFSCDPVALGFAKRCVDGGAAQRLKPIERVFAYLPFEHSEELAEQQCSVALFQALAEETAAEAGASATEAELFKTYLDYAHQHLDIVQRFDRFPHRNQILARRSTDEERAFLEQPGSSF